MKINLHQKINYEKLLFQFNQFKLSVDSEKLLSVGLSIVNTLAKPADLVRLDVLNESGQENDEEMV